MEKNKKVKILHDLKRVASAITELQDASEKIKFSVYGLIKDLDEIGEVVCSENG